MSVCIFFFFKQKTAYEMRISDWSSDVCSSDLRFKTKRARWGTTHRARHLLRAQSPIAEIRVAQLPSAARVPPHWNSGAVRYSVRVHVCAMYSDAEIGRASCRERVCQYV